MQVKKLSKLLLKFLKNWYTKFHQQYLIYETKEFTLENTNSFEQYGHEIGIVIQGPLNLHNNFSLEAIKHYKNLYPNILVVLSTWEGEDATALAALEKIGVKCITSPLLSNRGIKNINLQIESTKIGLEYLRKNNSRYAFKMRTDQWLDISFDFVGFCLNMINQFPLVANKDNPLNKKLLISSLNTYKERYYGVSDMFMFGEIGDMENYWCPKFDTKEMTDFVIETDNRFYMRQETAEGYLICEFMRAVHHKPQWTTEDHRLFMAKYFIIVDYLVIGHFWFKNNWWDRNTSSYQYLSFGEWLNMYAVEKENQIKQEQ